MIEISYTKVRAYLNCPWLYKLKFMDGWKAPPGPEASLGISLHKALEKFHGGAANFLEALFASLDDVWDRAGYQDASQELFFYDKARSILSLYLENIAKGAASHRRFQIMDILSHLPDLSVEDVADKLNMDYKNAAQHLQKLYLSGLVTKKIFASSTLHKLTERGKSILDFYRNLE